MKSAWLEAVGKIVIKETPVPEIQAGEALIKVSYAGICGSDLHAFLGHNPSFKIPLILGHEFSGTIEKSDNNIISDLKFGDFVVAHPVYSCGRCSGCASGQPNICKEINIVGVHKNGAFAEYVKVPANQVYRIPGDVGLKLACLTEPLAVALHDIRASGFTTGQSVLVIGAGPIGLLIGLICSRSGTSRVVITEINKYRKNFAEKIGLTVIDPTEKDFESRLTEISPEGYDVVFEASGTLPGASLTTKAAARGGTVVMVGIPQEPVPVDMKMVFVKELRIRGVRSYTHKNFTDALELLRNKSLAEQVWKLVSETMPFDNIVHAFDLLTSNSNLNKILLSLGD